MMTFEVTMLDATPPIVVSSQFLNRQDGEDEYHDAATPWAAVDPRKMRQFDHRVLAAAAPPRTRRRCLLGYRCANSGMTLACAVRHLVDTPAEPPRRDVRRRGPRQDGDHGPMRRRSRCASSSSSPTTRRRACPPRSSPTAATARSTGRRRRPRDDGRRAAGVARPVLEGRATSSSAATTRAAGVRWNLFKLAQASAQTQEHGIAAKGVTGSGYEGHYFWDTETYVVPFLAYTNPDRPARCSGSAGTRCRTPASGRELNQRAPCTRGARSTARRRSAYYAAGPPSTTSNAAIAFALKRYLDASGDIASSPARRRDPRRDGRLWEDLGFYATNGEDLFRIHGVTGPDEYTTVVNDNLYTNVMARFSMRYARVVESLAEWDHDAYEPAVPPPRAREERDRSDGSERRRRCTCPTTRSSGSTPRTTRSSSSSRGTSSTPPDHYPLLLHYHPLVIYRHQVLKQADVVLAMVLRSDQFSLEQKRRNFDYYDPITTGDSSLSACVQAMAAAQIGYDDLAVDYFREALFVDLADTHGNTSDGVHSRRAAAWGTIVFGFAGLFDNGTRCGSRRACRPRGRRHVPDATTRLEACSSRSTPTGARSTCSTATRADRGRPTGRRSCASSPARRLGPRSALRSDPLQPGETPGVAMKSIFFHLMPYRDLPDDFEERYESVWVTPPNAELCDPAKVAQYYKWNLDELELADQLGFDGIGVNEHHQNAYGFMASPNLMAAALPAHAEQQRHPRARQHARAVQAGAAGRRGVRHARLHDRRPPRRRLPGRHLDGRQPVLRHHADGDTRALLRGPRPDHEGVDASRARSRTTAASTSCATSTRGRSRCRSRTRRSGWPAAARSRPTRWPSTTTTRTASSASSATSFAKKVMDTFWETADRLGADRNPYRAGFAQQICVAETDAQAEELYLEHVMYFFKKCLHIPPYFMETPGYRTKRSTEFASRPTAGRDRRRR